MPFEEKDGLLLVVQIDHLSGEEVGWVLESEALPGIHSRQLIPTLTKKGRPSYLLLLDIDPAQEERVIQTLSGQMPLFGYHRLATQHIFQRGITGRIMVNLRTRDGRSLEGPVRSRATRIGRTPRTFFEAEDLLNLQQRAQKELEVKITLLELKQRLEKAYAADAGERVEIEL
ncbi:MAG: nickel insertion protein [Desulfobaccales bacterium]